MSGGHHSMRPAASSGLWGHLLRQSQAPSSTTSSTLGKHTPSIAPLDKAGASTRILLHDTQAHLEKFTDRVAHLTNGLEDAKWQLKTMQKLYDEEHEQVIERMISLVNRCQAEVVKALGTPAQSSEVREVSRDLKVLVTRLDSLDKKVDALSTLNLTQSQALQAIQEQQSQMSAAVLPMLPLLQSFPLHIETTRNYLKDSISGLCHRTPAPGFPPAPRSPEPSTNHPTQQPKRTRSRSSDLLASSAPSARKRLRSENTRQPATITQPSTPTSKSPPHHFSVLYGRIQQASDSCASNNMPSPDVSLSTIVSRASVTTVRAGLRTPLADLSPSLAHNAAADNDISGTSGGLQTLVSRPPGSRLSLASVVPASHTPNRTVHTQYQTTPKHVPTVAAPAGSLDFLISPVERTSAQGRTPSRNTPMRPRQRLGLATAVHDPPRVQTMSPVGASPWHAIAAKQNNRPQTPIQVAMGPPSVPPSSTGKPMSLKDRRALLPDDTPRNEGKRFIPLDDEDDEELGIGE